MRRALVIEDSPEYQILIKGALRADVNGEGFDTICAVSAAEAMVHLESAQSFDLILIDVGLPDRDGWSICEQLRKDDRWKEVPILFVTGRKETADIVHTFSVGADDYIQKPFHPEELRARIDVRLKKAASAGSMKKTDHFAKADLKFAIGRQKVLTSAGPGETDLQLTPNEFKILYHLARHEGRILSRGDILREVWGEHLHVVERTVDKHVCSLRRKMGDRGTYVVSVPGEGYTFRPAPALRRIAN